MFAHNLCTICQLSVVNVRRPFRAYSSLESIRGHFNIGQCISRQVCLEFDQAKLFFFFRCCNKRKVVKRAKSAAKYYCSFFFAGSLKILVVGPKHIATVHTIRFRSQKTHTVQRWNVLLAFEVVATSNCGDYQQNSSRRNTCSNNFSASTSCGKVPVICQYKRKDYRQIYFGKKGKGQAKNIVQQMPILISLGQDSPCRQYLVDKLLVPRGTKKEEARMIKLPGMYLSLQTLTEDTNLDS